MRYPNSIAREVKIVGYIPATLSAIVVSWTL